MKSVLAWLERRRRTLIAGLHKRLFDRHFDLAHGVRTSGRVAFAQPGGERWHGGNYDYLPTPPAVFRFIIGALPIQRASYAFVDLGAGKGRTLILSARLGFASIEGVEVDPALADLARANIKALDGAANIQVQTCDAADYRFPSAPLVVYLFNPFGEAVLAQVVRQLEASLAREPRDCWVVYFYPRRKAPLDASASLRPVRLGLFWRLLTWVSLPGDLALYRSVPPSLAGPAGAYAAVVGAA